MPLMEKFMAQFSRADKNERTHHTVPPLRIPENPYLPAVAQHRQNLEDPDNLPSIFELFAARRLVTQIAA